MANKGQFKKGDGRQRKPKGTPNTLTKTVREVVLNAFNELQTKPKVNLIEWAQANPKDFYVIASKLIPTEIVGSGQSIVINVVTPE